MPSTGHGQRRYQHQAPEALPATIVGGADLGPAMRPRDVMARLRHALVLDDREVVDLIRLGAARLAGDPQAMPELDDAEREALLVQAAEVTPSRVIAWRRRSREMTWHELRALLLGLIEDMRSEAG